jgi:nucleoside-diphosphate-sugar epimerase
VICIGGAAQVPAIHVDHAAAALVAAATLPQAGTPEVFNLVDPDPPTQDEWIAAAGLRPMARLPLGLMTGVAQILAVSGRILPPLARRIPTGLRPETLAARYRPLRYDAARARDTLGLAPARGFAESMAASREETR